MLAILFDIVFIILLLLEINRPIYICGCRVVGSVLIVFGLYVVLWGKHKETIEIKEEEIPEAIKGAQVNGNAISGNIEDIEANNGNIQMGKAEGGDHQNKAAAALSCCH